MFYCVVTFCIVWYDCYFVGIKISQISLSFLSMIIFEVLYSLKYNICSAWFLDITISICSGCLQMQNCFNTRDMKRIMY